MLSISNLNYNIGDRFLYRDLSLFIGPSEKVALAGKNGSGKTTLLNIIAEKSERGITLPSNINLGFLPQHLKVNSEKSIIEEVKAGLEDVLRMEVKMQEITKQLEIRTDYESDEYMHMVTELSEISERLGLLDLDKLDGKASRLLQGLGFKEEEFSRPYSTFSGGWKMRVELGKILLKEPDFLLLDEPTNHLDINSILWLEEYLKDFAGAVLIISHDRRFLDNLTTRTIEIANGQVFDFPFPYTKYQQEREFRFDQLKREAKNQEKEIKRTQDLIDKFKAKASKASMAKSLEKRLDKMDQVEIFSEGRVKPIINFRYGDNPGKEVLKTKQISKSFGNKSVLKGVDLCFNRGDKIALVGKNGIGKSTLIKIIAGIHKADEGDYNFGHNVSPAFFMQDSSEVLDDKKTVLKSIEDMASPDTFLEARRVLGSFLFTGDDVEKKVKVLSGGEKNRVVLASIAINPYNFLILDEPTNHLDIVSKEELQKALKKFPGTVLLVSHDRDFLHGLCNKVYEIKEESVKEFIGDIDDFLEVQKKSLFEFSAQNSGNLKNTETKQKAKQERKEEASKPSNNQIKKLEQQIEDLEASLKDLEADMATKAGDSLNSTLAKYDKNKASLDKLMAEWEMLLAN